jgi:hypothetical protein
MFLQFFEYVVHTLQHNEGLLHVNDTGTHHSHSHNPSRISTYTLYERIVAHHYQENGLFQLGRGA